MRDYEYDRSRSHVVVKRILGGRFRGHLVSDFYAGYNDYAGNHQRCWTHLLGDLRAQGGVSHGRGGPYELTGMRRSAILARHIKLVVAVAQWQST